MDLTMSQQIKQVADAVCEDMSYDSYKEFETADVEAIATACNCSQDLVCDVLRVDPI